MASTTIVTAPSMKVSATPVVGARTPSSMAVTVWIMIAMERLMKTPTVRWARGASTANVGIPAQRMSVQTERSAETVSALTDVRWFNVKQMSAAMTAAVTTHAPTSNATKAKSVSMVNVAKMTVHGPVARPVSGVRVTHA